MTALAVAHYRDRVLADFTDGMVAAEREVAIGASDAAKLAKPQSIEKYLATKLRDGSFGGNEFTASGNEWEPALLAYVGIPRNTLFIHSPAERGFAATPDGLDERPDGIVLAEAKAKHGRIVDGPTLAERRQVAWQQFCIGPDVLYTEWVWGEIVRGELRQLEPKVLRIYPADVEHLLQPMLDIAVPLLAMLRAARAFQAEAGL